MFKNLIGYRLREGWNLPANKLEEQLARMKDRRIGATERSCYSWAPVQDGALVLSVGGHRLFKMRMEERVLPASVIKKELNKRCEQLERSAGRKPGRKETRDLKDEIEMELLPKAFVKEKFIDVWVDAGGKWLGIDCSSRKTADNVMSAMVGEIDGLPTISLIHTVRSAAGVMEFWLSDGNADNGFELDDHCELVGHGDVKAVVRYAKLDLNREDIRQHMSEGKTPRSLGLVYDSTIAFVVNEALELKKIELINFTQDSEDEGMSADLLATGDALSKVLEALVESCGGEVEEEAQGSFADEEEQGVPA